MNPDFSQRITSANAARNSYVTRHEYDFNPPLSQPELLAFAEAELAKGFTIEHATWRLREGQVVIWRLELVAANAVADGVTLRAPERPMGGKGGVLSRAKNSTTTNTPLTPLTPLSPDVTAVEVAWRLAFHTTRRLHRDDVVTVEKWLRLLSVAQLVQVVQHVRANPSLIPGRAVPALRTILRNGDRVNEWLGLPVKAKEPKATWLTVFSDAWLARWPGSKPPFGPMARELKPLVDRDGDAAVLAQWVAFLADQDPKYVSVPRFTQGYGSWKSKGRRSDLLPPDLLNGW